MWTGFWWGNLRERDHLEIIGVDGRIILKWTFNMWDVAQTRDRWRAVVSAAMKFQVPRNYMLPVA